MVTITINGKEIEMTEIKARLWREIMAFEDKRADLPVMEAFDETCRIIAVAFGVTVDEVLDNLEIEDILPKYFEVSNAVVVKLTEKLGKKNADAAAQI